MQLAANAAQDWSSRSARCFNMAKQEQGLTLYAMSNTAVYPTHTPSANACSFTGDVGLASCLLAVPLCFARLTHGARSGPHRDARLRHRAAEEEGQGAQVGAEAPVRGGVAHQGPLQQLRRGGRHREGLLVPAGGEQHGEGRALRRRVLRPVRRHHAALQRHGLDVRARGRSARRRQGGRQRLPRRGDPPLHPGPGLDQGGARGRHAGAVRAQARPGAPRRVHGLLAAVPARAEPAPVVARRGRAARQRGRARHADRREDARADQRGLLLHRPAGVHVPRVAHARLHPPVQRRRGPERGGPPRRGRRPLHQLRAG